MSPRRPRPVRTVLFGPLRQPVRFRGCDDLIDAMRSILVGWHVRDADPKRLPAPLIRVARTRRGYRRVSKGLDRPSLVREKTRRTLVEALCGFHFEFLDWHQCQHPRTLFIHGAAVMFGRRLVVFPALAKAGKSLLTVELAAHGRRVYCDDVLPIDTKTCRGEALGIVPRLRPPLPACTSPACRRLVKARRGFGRKNRLYVNLRRGELAPLGQSAPIGGVVLLSREARGPAVLEALDPADALERIVLQNFAREVPTPLILDTLARVVEGAKCYRLRYARGADAVARLSEVFGPVEAFGPVRSAPPRRRRRR